MGRGQSHGSAEEGILTVQQLIDRLKEYPPHALVYVPCSMEGKNGTVQFIARIPHTNLPFSGIKIEDDVALLPGAMEGFVLDADATDEDRQGES